MHPVKDLGQDFIQVADGLSSTTIELNSLAPSLKNKWLPGHTDPVNVLLVVAGSLPRLLLRMYNACLAGGVFPARWKITRLMLIDKRKDGFPAPSSCRPLCTSVNLLEKLCPPRLHPRHPGNWQLSTVSMAFARMTSL